MSSLQPQRQLLLSAARRPPLRFLDLHKMLVLVAFLALLLALPGLPDCA